MTFNLGVPGSNPGGLIKRKSPYFASYEVRGFLYTLKSETPRLFWNSEKRYHRAYIHQDIPGKYVNNS